MNLTRDELVAEELRTFPLLCSEEYVIRALAQQALRPTADVCDEPVATSVARLATAYCALAAENVMLKAELASALRVRNSLFDLCDTMPGPCQRGVSDGCN